MGALERFNCSNAPGSEDLACWKNLAQSINDQFDVFQEGPSIYFEEGSFNAKEKGYPSCRISKLLTAHTMSSFGRCKQELSSYYKIHVMPRPTEVAYVVREILRYAQENESFARNVGEMKIILGPAVEEGQLLALVVVYPIYHRDGKEIANYVANELQKLLRNYHPLTLDDLAIEQKTSLNNPAILCPRDNWLLSSAAYTGPLICYAQGEGVDKTTYVALAARNEDSLTNPLYQRPLRAQGVVALNEDTVGKMLGYAHATYVPPERLAELLHYAHIESDRALVSKLNDILRSTQREYYFVCNAGLCPDFQAPGLIAKFAYLLKRKQLRIEEDVTRDRIEKQDNLLREEPSLRRDLLVDSTRFQLLDLYDVDLISSNEIGDLLKTMLPMWHVRWPVRIGDLFYVKEYNNAVYPPDFLAGEPKDYRLVAK
jgi:hypothetical protein